MRVTIHIVSARDYWPFTEAIRAERREWWSRAARRQVVARTVEEAARRVRGFLADGPLRREEIMTRLGIDTVTWNGVGLWVDLVRVPPSGTWERRRADLYGLAEDWVGPSTMTEEDGKEHLVRRYLGAFGPASRSDIASWSGLSTATLVPVLERLKLRRFADERGGELLDLPRGPLPEPDTPAPVRFLPTWDATLLVHARRTQILPEHFRGRVFDTKTPHSVPTFLVDGRVAGTWGDERGRVTLKPFERLSRDARTEVEEEAHGLEAFLA